MFIGGYLLANHLFILLFVVSNNVVYFVHNIRWLDCYWTYKWFTSKCRCIRRKWRKKDARNLIRNFGHVFSAENRLRQCAAKPKKCSTLNFEIDPNADIICMDSFKFVHCRYGFSKFRRKYLGIVYWSHIFFLHTFKRCKPEQILRNMAHLYLSEVQWLEWAPVWFLPLSILLRIADNNSHSFNFLYRSAPAERIYHCVRWCACLRAKMGLWIFGWKADARRKAGPRIAKLGTCMWNARDRFISIPFKALIVSKILWSSASALAPQRSSTFFM